MNRDEAIEKCIGRKPQPSGSLLTGFENNMTNLVDALAKLGILALDEPKSVEDEAKFAFAKALGLHCLDTNPDTVLKQLAAFGFKITKA